MAYNKTQIFNLAKEALQEDSEIVFFEDLCIEIGISKETFYRLLPITSNEYDELKRIMMANKSNLKKKIRTRWYESENPTLSICAYKLLSTEEERNLLADKQHIDTTAINTNINSKPTDIDSMGTEIVSLMKQLREKKESEE